MKSLASRALPGVAATAALLLLAFSPRALRAQDHFGDWSAPENLGTTVNSAYNDQHPALSPDGLSLIFVSDRPGGVDGALAGTFDLWVTHRDTPDSPWGEPQNLGPTINSTVSEFAPNFSNDGHYLLFGSDRPGGCGSRDIWVSHRKDKKDDFAWETPVNLGCVINAATFDDGPTYFEDPQSGQIILYFTSLNRSGGLGDFDIWQSSLLGDGTWTTPVNVVELNTSVRDTRTAISRDGLEIYLTSNRPGSVLNASMLPSLDIWVATRASTADPWGAPVDVTSLNSSSADGAPTLSRDGKTIFFYSNRPGGSGLNDLYVSTRHGID